MQSVNAMVGDFYRSALTSPLETFREELLHKVNQIVPFDAAMWGTSDADAEHFHSLSMLGLGSDFARHLERTRLINPMYHQLIENPDEAIDLHDLIDGEQLYQSDIYEKICKPYNIERALGTSCRDPRSRIYNLVVLYRFRRDRPFSDDEKRIHRHFVFHMMNAVSLAYTVHLSQASTEEGGSSAAICDRYRVCYDIQPSFLSMVNKKYPDWQGGRLPFDLPPPMGIGEFEAEGLRISSIPVGDLLCVRVREDSPMDRLTNREREIVRSVCRGLSYKEVARPLGIAPSTVSNHLYRVFEKLGVTSRTELAKMFNKARHLH